MKQNETVDGNQDLWVLAQYFCEQIREGGLDSYWFQQGNGICQSANQAIQLQQQKITGCLMSKMDGIC